MLTPHAKGVIYDTRSESVAVAARAKGDNFCVLAYLNLGGGKESRYHYSQWIYVHGNLPRIREFKESLTRLIEGLYNFQILILF